MNCFMEILYHQILQLIQMLVWTSTNGGVWKSGIPSKWQLLEGKMTINRWIEWGFFFSDKPTWATSKRNTTVYNIIPYGSKHCLRRYLTLQIIPQTLPKKVLGSIGIIYYQRKLGSNTSVLRTNRILRLEMMKGGRMMGGRSHNNT